MFPSFSEIFWDPSFSLRMKQRSLRLDEIAAYDNDEFSLARLFPACFSRSITRLWSSCDSSERFWMEMFSALNFTPLLEKRPVLKVTGSNICACDWRHAHLCLPCTEMQRCKTLQFRKDRAFCRAVKTIFTN